MQPGKIKACPPGHPHSRQDLCSGETHLVRIGFMVTAPINDGWGDYTTGYTTDYTYKLNPINIPTAVPTQTETPTLVPSPTKVPYVPPVATRAPAVLPTTATNLVYDITIKVQNNCSYQRTVIMDGPTHLKYVVDPGQTKEYQAPQGTYTWIIDNSTNSGPQDLTSAVWTLPLCN
ncbi:MAG: hypothetical protein C0401_12125 [Anaerolinea sp.]|nr:hypothetical protein [Anaerolinea sp.]